MIYKALSVLLLMTGSLHMMAAQDGTTEYTILTQSPEQHIQHFGASDAWSMQFLGCLLYTSDAADDLYTV